MTKPPILSVPTPSILADIRPTDDSAASIRDAIVRAGTKRAALRAHRDQLAAFIPQLTLEVDDDAQLDQVEADVRSADRDVARIDALIAELQVRLVPAQHVETVHRLAVQAQRTNETCDACRAWAAETMPAIVGQILQGARLRLSAKLAHQTYVNALDTSGLPAELAATLPTVAPPMSAMSQDRITRSTDQTLAASLQAVLRDAERLVAFR